MDNTAGPEHTKWVQSETFLGDIASFAGDKEVGGEKFKRHTDGPGELSLWTDNSRLESGCKGASLALCNIKYNMRKTYLGKNNEVFKAELYAIFERL